METVSVYDMAPPSGRKRAASQDEMTRLDPVIELQQDVCRHVINTELMMLYGHDVEGYLPPLPGQERPRSSMVTAWSCDNPAVRQLGNIRRRGPRSKIVPSCDPSATTRRSLDTQEDRKRPHTSYCDHVRGVLNTKPTDDIRPQTAGCLLDRANDKRLQPLKNETGLIMPTKLDFSNIKRLLPFLIMKERLGELSRDDATTVMDFNDMQSEVPSTVALAGGGLRKPKLSLLRKKKSNKGKGMRSFLDMEQQLNDNISRVVKGDIENPPDHPPTAVRIYLCSHPHDMLAEKRVLEREAYPELRRYCQQLGLELCIVDTHLPGSDINPADIMYRRRQLNKCQNQSVGPNFVALIGDYYGDAAIPYKLSSREYNYMHKAASVSTKDDVDATLLEECYRLDNNAIPPVYILQDPEKMSPMKCAELRFILKESVFTGIQIGKFRPEREKEFATSEMEHMLRDGILRSPGDLAAVKCLCFHRKYQGIHDDLENDDVAEFTDVTLHDGKMKINQEKQERLDNLASAIHSRLGESNMKGYEVTWSGVSVRENGIPEHQAYLKRLVRDFVEGMKRLIVLNNSQWRTKNPNFPLYKEVLHHATICRRGVQYFSDRPEIFSNIKDFLGNMDKDNRPLVLHGDNGKGRSSILSQICKTGSQLLNKPQCVAIFRQIGLTPNSCHLRTLLVDICEQICIQYNMDSPTEAAGRSVNNMVRIFTSTLETVSKHNGSRRPLLLLLDDIDKLPSKDRANTFFWLPRTCPKNVYIILTMNSRETEKLNKLHRRIEFSDNFIDIGDMSGKEALVCADFVLEYNKRQVTQSQRQVFKSLSHKGIHPLLLQMSTCRILTWQSDQNITRADLPDTVTNGLKHHLEHLQKVLGSCLVKTAATYLTLLRNGITETELSDVCVTTSEVIRECRKQTSTKLVYTTVRTKVNRVIDYLETLGLIQVRCFHSRTLLAWSNDQIRDCACMLYFGVSSAAELHESSRDNVLNAYTHLLELFSQESGLWMEDRMLYSSIGACAVTPQLLLASNIRKLNLMPFLISQCETVEGEDMETFLKRKCLCDYMWLLTKLQATGFTNYLEDLQLIKGHDLEVDLVLDFVSLCGFGLQQGPLSLALHMLGTMPYMHASRYPLVAEMIEVAKAWMMDQKFPLLVPAFMCFPSPLDQCKARLWNILDIEHISSANNLGVVKNKEGFLEIWDMVSEEYVFQTGVKFDKVTTNVYATEDLVLGINTPHCLEVWEIETGFSVYQLDLAQIFDENSSLSCHAHTEQFERLAIHTSDDDFNQAIVVLDTATGKTLIQNDKFDLKDEFFPCSVAFITIKSRCWLIFVNARSEAADNDKTVDIVKLNIYSVDDRKHKHTIVCGEKKFNSLLTKDDQYAIVCWTDCSFDVYNIEDGTHHNHFVAPDQNLCVQKSIITVDGYLVALACTTPEHTRPSNYHGLWFWNVDDSSNSELFVQEHLPDDDVPRHFIIIEDLHLAVLGTSETAKISIWDLPTGVCLYSLDAHVGGLDNIVKSPDPYRIYTCSSGEKVVKLWDIYNLVTCAKDQESQADVDSEAFQTPSAISSRGNSAATIRTIVKTPESIIKENNNRLVSGRSTRKSVRFAEYAEIADEFSIVDEDGISLQPSDSISVVDSSSSNRKAKHRMDHDGPRPPDDEFYFNPYKHSAAGSTTNMEISEFIGAGSGSLASGDGMASVADSDDMEAVVYGNTGQITMHSQLENMFDVTIMQYTKDSEFVVTGSKKGLPTIWDVKTGFPHLHMEKQAQDDMCTPWFTLACKDDYIVGLTGNNKAYKEGWPQLYKFQVWKRETGKAHKPDPEMDDIFVIKCASLSDGERVLVSILDNYRPGEKAEVRMQILHIERIEVLHNLRVFLPEIPDIQQVTSDSMYTILLSPRTEGPRTHAITVYNLEDFSSGEFPPPCPYNFRSGSKFTKYGTTSNIILRNGVSLAAGLNGDLQLWDINTGEYEGNLYHDTNVKDKANPGLHNHSGKQINHMALSEDGRYLVCGGGDGTTSLWDLDNEVQMHSYQGHKDEVRRVVITWDNQLVLTSGADCMLFVWPFAGDKPICQLFIHVVATDLQISEDKKTVCVIGNRLHEASRFMMFRLMNLRKLI